MDNVKSNHMKKFFILFLFLSSICVFSQEIKNKDERILVPKDNLYILDTYQKYRSVQKFAMDEDDCYFHVFNSDAVISFRFRNKNYFASGKIYKEQKYKIENDSILIFTLFTDNNYPASRMGKFVFIGVDFDRPNINRLYLLDSKKQINYILNAHIATDEERKKLQKRSDRENSNNGLPNSNLNPPLPKF